MIRHIALLAAILQIAIGAAAQTPNPQHAPVPGKPASGLPVVESGARAILENTAIHVTLPLNLPAGPETRVTLWLASPQDVRSGETAVELSPGSRQATTTLAWPMDSAGVPVAGIGWYRIGYRLDAGPLKLAQGVLSIGAITQDVMMLRVAYPRAPAHGREVIARVIAVNPVTGRPLPGVKISATLSDGDSDDTKSEIREGTTLRSGEAVLTFAPLGAPGDSLDLTVEGTLSGPNGTRAHEKVSMDLDVDDQANIAVETDKPLHKPGETVHLRALAFGDDGRAAADEPITVEIKDHQNKTLAKDSLKTNRFGIASYDWKTTEQTASDDYEVSFDLDNRTAGTSTGGQTVRIQRYELPEFRVTATPDRPFYLSGDVPSVKIHAGYLFGKPVAAGTIRIVRSDHARWNLKTGKYDEPKEVEESAELNVSGDATVTLKVPDDFDELKNSRWERFRDVQYRAMVTDATTGRTEPRNFVVRLSSEPVHIYLNPIGTNEREGEYMLSTSFADGSPAPCKVTLDWMDAQSHPVRAMAVRTNRYGLAKVTLHYPADESARDMRQQQIRVTALDPEGRLSHFDDTLWPSMGAGIWLSIDHPLLRPGQRIEGTIHYRPGEQVDLDVLSDKSVLQHLQIRMGGSEQQFSIPSTAAFHGLITLRAFNMNDEGTQGLYLNRSGAIGTVLYPEDRSLSANVKGLADSYIPGAKVNAELGLRNSGEGAIAGVFGVSVIDTAVEQRAETEAEENSSWFSRGSWWLQGPSVGDVTRESLNKTDMSKPISADLELAAEAVLMNSGADRLGIESSDDNTARNDYQKEMTQRVRPLGDAILARAPSDLPATFGDLKKFATEANQDATILMDPWNVPYRVEASEAWSMETLNLRSAGPDKQFGTADDFTLTLVNRNVFAGFGMRLNEVLREAVNAGNPLPATAAVLKQVASDAGLDLDSVRRHTSDRGGQPYKYGIETRGRYYFVEVDRDSGETVWQSAGIDYFRPTQELLNSALEKWTAAKNIFPETEADARRAFAAAGVDFDSLRDPLGRPFAVNAKQDSSYAHIYKAKAGETIQGETAKVTLVADVIEILPTGQNTFSFGGANALARFAHTISQQSGSDLNPVTVDYGLFKGSTGAIGGTVTDPSGAVIAGAKIQVEENGEVKASAVSANDGTYLASDLAAGLYTVSISSSGFKTFVLREVHVSSSALTTADVKLELGSVSESIAVESRLPVNISAESAEVSRTSFQLASGRNGSAKISEITMTPRLRHVFEETAYWSPSLETNNAGRATFSFTLPDSLTTWKLRAVGSTRDGRITEINQNFRTFQPFFVDLDTPQVLTSGDEISLSVNLRNYTAHSITVPVNAKTADWFTLSTPASTQSTIAANATASLALGIRTTATVDAGPLRITAANAQDGDAVEKTVKVHPDGEPRTVTVSELLRGGAKNTFDFNVPANAIRGSLRTQLLLYPNLGANVAHSMQAVLERPYGCAEQTISSTYTSLLFLELTNATKSQSPLKDKAAAFLQQGYDRLLGYFGARGGLTYWGANDPDEDAALTAYGIEFLTESEPFVEVDRSRITAAIQWLLTQQNPDGSWNPRYGAASARETLYIANALSTVMRAKDLASVAPGTLPAAMKQAIAKAEAFAALSLAALHDPYSNALRLTLAVQSGDAPAITRLRGELNGTAEHQTSGAHWEFDGYSPFYGWGSGGKLEATAMALTALQSAASQADEKLENDALLYLLQNRDAYGVWLSGQATVRVLKALVPVAVKQLEITAPQNFGLVVNGQILDGEQSEALKADSRLLDAPRAIDLTSLIRPGANTLEFASASDAAAANAQLTSQFYVPWKQEASGQTRTTVPGKNFGFDFAYNCDAADAKVGQSISCTVSARRFGAQNYGMMVAEVGLPPGADVDRASLAKLLAGWMVSRYELQPDRIVFYLWSSRAEGQTFSFSFTPRYAIRAKAAPASLTDYYNPELSAVLAPPLFVINGAQTH